MNFKEIPAKYRPIPFWSWNERLETEETARQIRLMHGAGMGGFIMHARGGLETEYMGEEWFENVTCSVTEGKSLGMEIWAYDENGWPSGFGGGIVNGKGEKHRQKYLRMEEGEKHTPCTICNIDGFHYYYEVNPFYVDTLDAEVTGEFIKEIYEPYYEKYRNEITGFFTDEPQISRNGMPWSLKLLEEYEKVYGEELISRLDELFIDKGNFQDTRIKFWKLVTELFSRNYMKQIYDWCTERGLALTGHVSCEETLSWQITSNGAVMPHYEYFTMPGIDWLGRNIDEGLLCRQLGSAAQQLGKKQVLTESFGLCGHNTGFEEFRRICEWQMVRGINRLCQHLEGYSLRGIRKRDYPPAMYYQQPWWEEYEAFNTAMSRVGMILAEGKPVCDTLLLHPQTTAWSMFHEGGNEDLEALNGLLLDAIRTLEAKHIQFHLGDEILIERHGRVEGDAFVIGEMRYTRVVVLPGTILLEKTRKLLEAYAANGGKMVAAEEIPADPIVDNPCITYTKRLYDKFTVHYFVNSTDQAQRAFIERGSKKIDLLTGEQSDFDGSYEFAPYDSLLILEEGRSGRASQERKELSILRPEGDWELVDQTLNVLTLDHCRYFFEDELMDECGYVLDIQEKACQLKRPVRIRQEYEVEAEYLPEELYLVMETPEKFTLSVNGVQVPCVDRGAFLDRSFRKIPIHGYFRKGKNKIMLETLFKQPDSFYEDLEKACVFESEKNKLTYESEIEAIYLAGTFRVLTDGKFTSLEKKAVRYVGSFCIGKPAEHVRLDHLEKQGYPFFAGRLVAEKKIMAEDTNQKLVFDKKGVNVIGVEVNGKSAGKILWNPTELDLSVYLQPGENTLRITLINNLRNMLGPHHLEEGESYIVTPTLFHRIKGVWANEPVDWNDGYTFVEFGIL